ncbi:MAG: L-lactate dehydrogenase [Xanthomonadales bacterium]|nr:L-lactate dehydrogenase [Xanthomonadales bacterium]
MGTYHVTPVTAGDYRRLAEKRLPRFLFDYIDGGAGEEQSMAANADDFSRIKLRQRVMRDVSKVDTGMELFGQSMDMPVVLAPVGLAGMMGRRGEVQGARGAATAGVPFTTSTVGICPIEEVNAAVPQPAWFQLYMLRDRQLVQSLLGRAQDSGCDTLVFTVDLAVTGPRHRDTRNGMLGGELKGKLAKLWQIMLRPRWILDVGIRGKPHDFGNLREAVVDVQDLEGFKAFIDRQFDPSVTWQDIAWLRTQWQGNILIKGVMSAEDACQAVDAGADGVIVSNHGGRQLEGVASSISMLPEVVAAVGDRAEVLMDGGVRNGTDVVRALASGAKAVMIGRPWVYAMAACGETGVARLLSVFQQEMARSMALMGVTRVGQLTSETIDRP